MPAVSITGARRTAPRTIGHAVPPMQTTSSTSPRGTRVIDISTMGAAMAMARQMRAVDRQAIPPPREVRTSQTLYSSKSFKVVGVMRLAP